MSKCTIDRGVKGIVGKDYFDQLCHISPLFPLQGEVEVNINTHEKEAVRRMIEISPPHQFNV